MSDTGEDQHEIEATEARMIVEALGSHDDAVGLMARMNEGVFEASGLDARTFLLVRLAAAAAMGAGTTTWTLQEQLLDAFDVDARDALRTLVAIAPLIGSVRFAEAVDRMAGD